MNKISVHRYSVLIVSIHTLPYTLCLIFRVRFKIPLVLFTCVHSMFVLCFFLYFPLRVCSMFNQQMVLDKCQIINMSSCKLRFCFFFFLFLLYFALCVCVCVFFIKLDNSFWSKIYDSRTKYDIFCFDDFNLCLLQLVFKTRKIYHVFHSLSTALI